jgi:hypothetical protein
MAPITGYRGILKEEFLDLTQETSHNIEMVASTPSSALGSTRDKPDLKYCHEIFEVLKGARHRLLLLHRRQRFIGHGAHRQRRSPARRTIPALHPYPEDHRQRSGRQRPHAGISVGCPFCRQAFMGANLDNAALPGVYLAVVMGRHAGFLTAASALGKKFPG